jgi:hypothetical protein
MAKFSVLPLPGRTKKGNTSESVCDDNLPTKRSHNWRGIMSAPTSSGCRGMGDLVGAALSRGESGPDFITALESRL